MTHATETATEPPIEPLTVNTQHYLIGDTIYLRGPELGDAKWTTAWRPAPFPMSAELAEEKLKKDVPEALEKYSTRLVACRREDGRPVGSALVNDADPTSTSLSLHADPALGSETGARLQAEMLGVLAPWLSGERFRPNVVLATDVDLGPVVKKAEALGMLPAVRLREGVWRDGCRHDRVFYELLNPVWTARLGDPGPGIREEGEPVLSPRARSSRRDSAVDLPLPPNAIIGSERLALRPMQVDDAEPIANMLLAEPDASFGHSRFPYSAVAIGDWFGEISEHEPPTDIEFAVVLRESGALIGETGLYDIDWLARTAESGYWLYRPEFRNQGYGTEANLLLLEYAFERIALNMIWAWVKARNPRSQAALRKQGFRDAGRFHWTGYGPEGFEDALMFDLLADEWRGARDQ